MTIDQQFIDFIVKSIVSNPDDVSIERTIDEKGVLLELTVNPEDLGRVIGKRGNTAQSMRTLLRALGTKNDARYNLKIIDNGEPKPERKKKRESRESQKEESSNESESAKPEEENSSAGANQWAHLSSSNDDSSDDSNDEKTDDDKKSSTTSTSSSIEQTKKELADLDDIGL